MERFDQLLRRGLMDANLAQYENALSQAESGGPDFSPRYLRERTRLLADPWGWARRFRRKRLDWRLIAVIAALLILSACAYAVAAGQFTQWFPWLGVNSETPEASEDVMTRMGTIIEQSQTTDGKTLTLHAAVWDGASVRLSLTAECAAPLPDLTSNARIDSGACSLTMPEDQWKDYMRKEVAQFFDGADVSQEQIEDELQFYLEMGQTGAPPLFSLTRQEGGLLAFSVLMPLNDYLERPELTLHVEDLAIYPEGADNPTAQPEGASSNPEPDAFILKGPYDFTFTLENLIPPVCYTGSIQTSYDGLPLQYTQMEISVLKMTVDFEIMTPVNILGAGPDSDKPDVSMPQAAAMGLQGIWTKDGKYIDCTETYKDMGAVSTPGGQQAGLSVGCVYPYAIDPSTVAAVNLGGTRVELSEWTRQTG